MNAGMEQFPSPTPANRSLESAASEFRTKVEDAATRPSGAAEQFVAMSEGLMSAVEEARQAADRAQQAQQKVEELQQRMSRDYGNVSELVKDLQERIGALAVLAKPLHVVESQPEAQEEPEQSQPTPHPLYSEAPGEHSW